MEKVSVFIKIRVLFWPEISALGVFLNFDNKRMRPPKYPSQESKSLVTLPHAPWPGRIRNCAEVTDSEQSMAMPRTTESSRPTLSTGAATYQGVLTKGRGNVACSPLALHCGGKSYLGAQLDKEGGHLA